MAKNVLIVGMPRSGTSLSAAIFVRKNYYIADNKNSELRNPDTHNPFGYYEAATLIDKNVEIFKAADYSSHNTWLFSEIENKNAQSIDELTTLAGHVEFVDSQNQHSPWVWKDPRLCYTLPYWWKLLDKENTAVLLLTRAKEDIFQSFVRLGWRNDNATDREEVYRRIENHWKFAQDAVDKYSIPHVKIDYSEYLNSPNEVARKIADFFKLDLDESDLNVKKDLNHGSSGASAMARLGKKFVPYPRIVKLINLTMPRFITENLFPEQKYVK